MLRIVVLFQYPVIVIESEQLLRRFVKPNQIWSNLLKSCSYPITITGYYKRKTILSIEADSVPRRKLKIVLPLWIGRAVYKIWSAMKLKLQKRVLTIKQLTRQLRNIWNSVSSTMAENLVESMTRRCQAIMENCGDWTAYR